ncbi:DUF2163 domain-containing protein [Breoghania sp. L-A4]|uniref:DUF2163 domain-containing protein n=1 Tax=Breoghania sp. L-A4 TaxID=2304600 RepID=UPI000E3600DC|nr:DUF2163 domain-containing protein [Breoghania sp. L-A4]AXS39968.1 DUF2163 domain-containing protein [Breoghania sp. L-A4]
MKTLDPGLAEHVSGGATSLCTCWKATRGDGVTLGFTDHDRDIAFDGTLFAADSGPQASEATAGPGLAVGGEEIFGAFSSEALSAADLEAGLWDRARIEVWRVNWRAPSERVLLRVGEIGEVTRADRAFRAEVRSLAQALEEVRGRVFSHLCDADLGDARCGVDLEDPAFRATGVVLAGQSARRFSASGLQGFADGWFERGLLRWLTGGNAGASIEVAAHAAGETSASLELWLEPAAAIVPGDTFTLTAGCDKRAGTCEARFANLINFRGFPHMPGNDFVLSYPNRDTGRNDGSAMVGG